MAKKSDDKDVFVEILNKVDSHTEELRLELQGIRKDISSINVTAAKHQAILEEHMRRTEANEAALKIIEETHAAKLGLVEDRIKPIEAHIAMWGGAGKVLTVLGILATILASIYKVFY